MIYNWYKYIRTISSVENTFFSFIYIGMQFVTIIKFSSIIPSDRNFYVLLIEEFIKSHPLLFWSKQDISQDYCHWTTLNQQLHQP